MSGITKAKPGLSVRKSIDPFTMLSSREGATGIATRSGLSPGDSTRGAPSCNRATLPVAVRSRDEPSGDRRIRLTFVFGLGGQGRN